MKSFLLSLFLLIIVKGNAQIIGSTEACAGYVYDYSVNVSGAASYQWTLPVGWILKSGQGSSQINVMCNTNIGQVCVDALDSSGSLISNQCMSVSWGGGGAGWDAAINMIGMVCDCPRYTVNVNPNGSTCPGTCGSGTPSTKSFFAVYSGPWPSGNYYGPANNSTPYYANAGSGIDTWYVYLIDTTLGVGNPVLISGGSCGATINNTLSVQQCTPIIPTFNISPDPVCVGDTFTVTENQNLLDFYSDIFWTGTSNFVIISPPNSPVMQGVATSASPSTASFSVFASEQIYGCHIAGNGNFNINVCSTITEANFTASTNSTCVGVCISFTNTSQNATSYLWHFPGSNTASSTTTNPAGICYSTPGSYDVELIAYGTSGNDTALITNAITVFQPVSPTLTLINDTIWATQGLSGYMWLINNIIVTGWHQSYCPVTQDGDYTVVTTDANGCYATAELFGIVAYVENNINDNSISIYPTPASNELTIENKNSGNPIGSICISNAVGQIIFRHGENIKGKYTIDTSMLANGIYFMKIETGNGNYIQKIIIQK